MNTMLLLFKITLLLAGALTIVRMLGTANPRWRMLVCEGAVIGLLLLPILSLAPVSIALPFGAKEKLAGESLPAPEPASAAIPMAGSEAGAVSAPVVSAAESPSETAVISSGPTTAPNRWTLSEILLAGYLAVILFLVGRWLVVALQLRRVLASLRQAPEHARRTLRLVSAEAGICKTPCILVTDTPMTPLACGLGRGTIVVPSLLLEPGNESTLRMALRHELHHLANRDLARSLGLQLLAIALWFHPLMWLLRRCHGMAVEELSDRVASEASGAENYSSALASLALTLCPERRVAVAGPAMGWIHSSQIMSRLHKLKKPIPYQPLSLRAKLGGAMFLAGPMLWLISSLGIAEPEPQAAPGRSGLAATMPKEERKKVRKTSRRILKYLVGQQDADGSLADARNGTRSYPVALTAMAGMAFEAHGGMDPESKYHKPMLRCLNFVLREQKEDGSFGNMMYEHSIATCFLASTKAGTQGGQARINAALEKSLQILLTAQAVKKNPASQGGWRYSVTSRDSDLSATSWSLRALLAARKAGHAVPEAAIADGLKYVLSLQGENGGFGYTTKMMPSFPRTGMGLSLLALAGMGDSPQAAKAAAYLLKNLPKVSAEPPPYDLYGLYWAAVGTASRGGEDAAKFADWMYPYLVARQQEDGSYRGTSTMVATAAAALALEPGTTKRLPQPLKGTANVGNDAPVDPVAMKNGKKGYAACVACHGVDGKGVPNISFQPLGGSAWVNGSPEDLIRMQLRGLTGTHVFEGKPVPIPPMPPMAFLTDESLASTLTYVRNSFGNQSSVILPSQVKALRHEVGKPFIQQSDLPERK